MKNYVRKLKQVLTTPSHFLNRQNNLQNHNKRCLKFFLIHWVAFKFCCHPQKVTRYNWPQSCKSPIFPAQTSHPWCIIMYVVYAMCNVSNTFGDIFEWECCKIIDILKIRKYCKIVRFICYDLNFYTSRQNKKVKINFNSFLKCDYTL